MAGRTKEPESVVVDRQILGVFQGRQTVNLSDIKRKLAEQKTSPSFVESRVDDLAAKHILRLTEPFVYELASPEKGQDG